jgi:hypothetical protein
MPQPAYLTPIGGSRSQPEEPAFSVAAAATNWFNDTPTVAANSAAAFFTDVGSFNGWVFLLISSISGAVELLCLRPGGHPNSPTYGQVKIPHPDAVNRRRSAPS